ncbi:MAG: putative lipoprotein, partial [Gammaproteobacteria bacterium]|nr:putative lipoprotein [Gammaproteobacteria bacterium]
MISRYVCRLSLAFLVAAAHAAPAPFDLAGPVLQVTVSRGAATLPASEVPNLAAGDRIWLKADLPPTQSAHYLLVAAFLRGSTNPPPESWFFPCKTWKGKCASEGLKITVPQDAQQVLIFLAPETGGDFKTLVSAVRGRPGAFVRTSQDLTQAALDRSRLERYLLMIRGLNDTDPAKIAQVAPLLARSLAIKVDEKCLDRLPELQAPCLMLGQESLILNDGHSTSIVEALTTGPGSDLAMEASYTPQLSYGYYSPYIASVLDIARIFASFGTAQYQYIPALASQRGDKLALTLNTAPSFHNPLSVLVAALPAVETAQLPPLHAVNPKEIYCARKTALVLPVEGAPLVFSTGFAHDVTLSFTGTDGKSLDLPATADPAQGGYVVDTSGLGSTTLGDSVQASLRGYWGFDAYQGPRFRLMNSHARTWELATGDEAALIVGRQDTVHLRADSTSCVDAIMLKDPAGKELKAEWKSVKPNEVEVKLPLQEAKPGAVTLFVTQYGVPEPQPVALQVFAEAGRF